MNRPINDVDEFKSNEQHHDSICLMDLVILAVHQLVRFGQCELVKFSMRPDKKSSIGSQQT